MAQLPPGVVKLTDGETAPPKTLAIYRDSNRKGPAYGIGAGFAVNLSDLPMDGHNGTKSASKNISSWVNNTDSDAVLIDDTGKRTLQANSTLEESSATNDSVTRVEWVA
ncbi:hypothetical protein ACGF13_26665 [Kitasatospora sp. NPDC048286]|uniref:hypothetical protein n=1 Tax=unclassified Kitasatospora TaxID=2633591 RepID=UPI00371F1703